MTEKRTDKGNKYFKKGIATLAITGTVLTGAGAFLLFTGPGHSLVNSTVTTSQQAEQKVAAASRQVEQKLPASMRDDQEIEGTLQKLSDRSMTIDVNGDAQTYDFASSVEREAVQKEDWVKIDLNANQQITELEREDQDDRNDREDDGNRSNDSLDDANERYGVLRALSQSELTLEQDGQETIYAMADRVERDTVKSGDIVKIELNADGQVRELDREEDDENRNDARDEDRDDAREQEVRGTLSKITNQEIIIEQNGTQKSYSRASNMEQDDDVRVGGAVKLELNASDEVTEIDE
ncbi:MULTISPECIES: hypothetical protein [unclassified Exiguobacterium]|uniref:hypothetical protein n=1 Tax=unclassified Exiguobacterium TaxID=2644629 RepID=UPI0025BA646A|nr:MULTISPECIES: hypothetical protein [unclassified Exiguobacterium]MDT0173192.1 hypothetical protein [Exiguobacterium sp. BRG2]